MSSWQSFLHFKTKMNSSLFTRTSLGLSVFKEVISKRDCPRNSSPQNQSGVRMPHDTELPETMMLPESILSSESVLWHLVYL